MNAPKKAFISAQADLIGQVEDLVRKAEERNIQLRAIGGVGIMTHCRNRMELLETMNRLPSDLDFVASSKQDRKIDEFFKDMGYTEKGGQGVTMEVWTDRRIFEHPTFPHVDVFFDGLDFCHKIDYKKRLGIDNPTLSPADLMLGKLQIYEINEKDLQDLMILNLEHRLGDDDSPEMINAQYLAQIMSQDWGFYTTSLQNLKKVLRLVAGYRDGVLSSRDARTVETQVNELIRWLDSAPKSFKWKARSKIGTKVKWYKNPGEEYREVAEG